MTTTMKAAANIIAKARDLLSAAGRSHLDTHAHVPEVEFGALEDAMNEYDEHCRTNIERVSKKY